jgi:hypothetical protein
MKNKKKGLKEERILKLCKNLEVFLVKENGSKILKIRFIIENFEQE